MIDAGMNDLMRPALYQARHRVVPLTADPRAARAGLHQAPADPRAARAGLHQAPADTREPRAVVAPWRVVGPVCESSDDFGVHELPDPAPELVALLDAGAYGYSMASRYNGRALPAEAFVSGGAIVARRERRADEDWVDERATIGRASS
jgi:diaminopimelate decarboxylase